MTKHPHYEILNQKLDEAILGKSELRFFNDFYKIHSPSECQVALSPQNKIKNKGNRWGLPFDHNLIESIPDYINASPMHVGSHRYIAAQGPRKHTINEFWKMVWAEKSQVVVSVTNEIEPWEGVPELKFVRFWPESDEESYGLLNVALREKQVVQTWDDGRKEKIVKRTLNVSHEGVNRSISHFHLENWPDNGVVHPESLYALRHHVDEIDHNGTIVVHCAAGIGRTGTFIAFHSLYHDLLQYLQGKKIMDWDVIKRIKEMRKLRWGSLVGDDSQFELLINALRLSLEKHCAI